MHQAERAAAVAHGQAQRATAAQEEDVAARLTATRRAQRVRVLVVRTPAGAGVVVARGRCAARLGARSRAVALRHHRRHAGARRRLRRAQTFHAEEPGGAQ